MNYEYREINNFRLLLRDGRKKFMGNVIWFGRSSVLLHNNTVVVSFALLRPRQPKRERTARVLTFLGDGVVVVVGGGGSPVTGGW